LLIYQLKLIKASNSTIVSSLYGLCAAYVFAIGGGELHSITSKMFN